MCDGELSPTPNLGLSSELKEWKRFLTDTNWPVAEYGTVSNWVSAVSVWLLDASLLYDSKNLRSALEVLRNYHTQGVLGGDPERLLNSIAALAELAQAALNRASQQRMIEAFSPEGFEARILFCVEANPDIERANMLSLLDINPYRAARLMSSLIDEGLIVSLRTGSRSSRPGFLDQPAYGLRLTPRGEALVRRLRERQQAPKKP